MLFLTVKILNDSRGIKDDQHADMKDAFVAEYEKVAQKERVTKIIYETYNQELKRQMDKLRQKKIEKEELVAEEERLAAEARLKAIEQAALEEEKDAQRKSKKLRAATTRDKKKRTKPPVKDVMGMNSPKKFKEESMRESSIAKVDSILKEQFSLQTNRVESDAQIVSSNRGGNATSIHRSGSLRASAKMLSSVQNKTVKVPMGNDLSQKSSLSRR